MGTVKAETAADFDRVGSYRQDRINGFSESLILSLLDHARIEDGQRVLEAMSGDGNLAAALLRYCDERALRPPQLSLLDASRLQSAHAKARLLGRAAEVFVGNAVTMTREPDGSPLPSNLFHRVLVKSGNHEIPDEEQGALYRSIFRVLRPGGIFVNLGFLFDDEEERSEFRQIARTKDALAGLDFAVRRRHFLTREELYSRLELAGFTEIRCARHCEYTIRSEAVLEEYFRDGERDKSDLAHQAAQLAARTLRARGRVLFEGGRSIMRIPGEITVAHKPPSLPSGGSPWSRWLSRWRIDDGLEENS